MRLMWYLHQSLQATKRKKTFLRAPAHCVRYSAIVELRKSKMKTNIYIDLIIFRCMSNAFLEFHPSALSVVKYEIGFFVNHSPLSMHQYNWHIISVCICSYFGCFHFTLQHTLQLLLVDNNQWNVNWLWSMEHSHHIYYHIIICMFMQCISILCERIPVYIYVSHNTSIALHNPNFDIFLSTYLFSFLLQCRKIDECTPESIQHTPHTTIYFVL